MVNDLSEETDDAGWFTMVKFPRIFVYSESTARIVSALPETITLPRYCPGYVSTISSPSAAPSTAVCMLFSRTDRDGRPVGEGVCEKEEGDDRKSRKFHARVRYIKENDSRMC
jgi:hypothetical protein